MRVDDILERNRAFVRGRAPARLAPPEAVPVAVLACYDPRLDVLLGPALGLPGGGAIVLRSAGAFVPPQGDPLRSLALAVYLFGVTDLFVVGHTSCRMAAFETAPFIDAFRRRGVRREAFGAEDLRAWAGAIPDPRRGVVASVASLKAATLLPGDLRVAGLLLDDATGVLDLVTAPGTTTETMASAGTVTSARTMQPAGIASPPEEEGPEETEGADLPAARGATEEVRPSPSPRQDPIPEAARTLARALSARRWRGDLDRLRADLDRQRDPFAQIAMVETFVRRAAAESRAVGEAFERLKREAAPPGRRPGPREVVDLFRRATREGGTRQGATKESHP
jgi:carbonic anhydrase